MSFHNTPDNSSNTYNLTGQILFGIVVNNQDPLMQSRLQIRVSLLHQNYPDTALPWVLPIQSNFQGNAPGIGGTNVPVTGSKVAVFFPENDATNTYWIGSSISGNTVLVDFQDDYPNSYGWVDGAGNMFKVNTTTKTWTWNMVDGSYIQFSSGTLNIVATINLNVNIQGSANINVSGNAQVAASGQLDLFGSVINLNTGSPSGPSVNPIPRSTPPVTSFTGQVTY